ncbi:6-bladed beta-propeller [Natronoflexus pectinivorans]|uniref:6-bladed beta-propeller protein n=1 Tax=Natronoflexus pectinivorans TaxID=682526 RepID=A0A4R2GJK7_9BACT|nr:6-bladed beta-propeller [Natronoflexus pectinivorans]TCO08224.1 6-bladed beta-propeller protein [Natronoflexus pectinivorans]
MPTLTHRLLTNQYRNILNVSGWSSLFNHVFSAKTLRSGLTFTWFPYLINVGAIILLLTGTNCSRVSDDFISIHLKPNNEKVQMSKFIDEVEYLTLRAPRGVRIGAIEKVIVHNNEYFIRHTPSNPAITVFDSDGRFKHNIGKHGRGPGEYVGLHDFTINHQQNEVVLMDLMVQKMHYYCTEGKYKFSNDLPIHALKFSWLNDDDFIFWVGNLYNDLMNKDESQLWNVYVVNKDLNIKSKYLEVPKEFMGVMNGSSPSSLSPYKEGVNIVSPLSNYIYHYRKGEFRTKYYLDFGSLNCDFINEFRQYNGLASSFVFNLRKTGATYYSNQFFEFENHLYFTFISNDKMYSVIYDKLNEASHVGIGYPDDDINNAIFGRAVGNNQNRLITVIEPLLLLDDEEKFPEKLEHLRLSPRSNAFLALYKLH